LNPPSLSSGVRKNLNSEDIKNFVIRLPQELKDQRKVAAVLSALDAKIDCNNRINAELEAMAKALYDYWFVQFEFPDANGKPYKSSGGKMVYNATLKREIPEGWEDKQLTQIANITMGSSPTGDSLNDIGEGVEFFQGSTDFGWQYPTVRQYTTQSVRMAKRGDILLSVRAPVGDFNIAHIDCCIGRGLAALNSKNGFDGFLFYVMQYFKQVFDRRNGEGTTFGSITKDDLHSLPLVYPPTELLEDYDKVVSGYNKMVFNRSMENQQLAQLRDWLLPLLMNGQVTVA
jgi:type I restriction enzyme S subunit